jgi:hypothetical protein
MATRERWTLVAAGAVAGVTGLLRHRRSAPLAPAAAPLPPLTTQSSPGQIADLQQAYGADMAAQPAHEG